MPGAGDGLTVVSVMRHANPLAVTLLLSAFPEMSAASNAISLRADEILVKPMAIAELIKVIKQWLERGPLHERLVETVAGIMERTVVSSIADWNDAVERDQALSGVSMSRDLRSAHLPQLFGTW